MRWYGPVAGALLLALAAPVEATHIHPAAEPYLLGGMVWITDDDYAAGATLCTLQTYLGEEDGPCIGGNGDLQSQHDDRAEGYHRVLVSVIDDVFGVQTAFSAAVFPECDPGTICETQTGIIAPCGVPGVVDSTQDGFAFVAVVVFIMGLYVDASTNEVCSASAGDLAAVFGGG